MSGDSVPAVRSGRRRRLLAHLNFRGPASTSLSSAPTAQLGPAVTLSTSQVAGPSSTQASSSTATTGAISPSHSNAGTGPQTTPTPSPSPNLLEEALKRLSDGDRATLQEHICQTATDVSSSLEQALFAAKEKQRYCVEKRWTFTVKGRKVVLKEKADKIVRWLDRFAKVGDVVANVDPVHVGLPWAGIRLLLEVIRPSLSISLRHLTFDR